MSLVKYKRWLDLERKASEAEKAVRTPSKNWKGWHPPTSQEEASAKQLRAEADSLFEDAMQEMNSSVQKALNKPIRQPR